MTDADAKEMLDLAARAAFRGTGHVEPNPLVGCVLVRPGDGPARERVIGIGHHRKFGGPHAEVEALKRCRELGNDPRGATAYVTLEPCNGFGKNPPCVTALVEAGIARVVCAGRDETEGKGSGGAALRAIGIPCEFTDVSRRATDLSEPWRHRLKTPLPWVIAKWAQTIDGKLATSTGDSKWISNERSRLRVHRMRAAVDAVMVGSGTVKADNPMLTARGVPVRRKAARVVVSARGTMEEDRALARTAGDERAIMVCFPGAERIAGVEQVVVKPGSGWLRAALAKLRSQCGVQTLMVEGGGKLLGIFFRDGLVNEAHVHTGPRVLADDRGSTIGEAVAWPPLISGAPRWRLLSVRAVGDDVQSAYRLAAHARDQKASEG